MEEKKKTKDNYVKYRVLVKVAKPSFKFRT